MEEILLGKYIFCIKINLESRKTPIYNLFSREDRNIYLGEIKWCNRWRKYCFYSVSDSIFDEKCLTEIINFLNSLKRNKGVNE